jgi:molybdopterin-binding protein
LAGRPQQANQEDDVALSARNQLRGTVKSVKLGTVMAEVVVDVGGNEIVSAITRGSAEGLGLSEGTAVTVVIKATEVLLATDGT